MAYEVSLKEQLLLFVYSLIIGMVIGVIYDVFRVSRVVMTGAVQGGKKAESKPLEDLILKLKGGIKHSQEQKHVFKNAVLNIIIFFEDILFFLITAVVFTVFLYQANYGQPRLYVYISSFLGFALYYNTIGRLSAVIFGFILSLIRLIVVFVEYKIVKPILSLMFRLMLIPIYTVNSHRIKKQSSAEGAKLLIYAECGFGCSTERSSSKE